ncbi:hypothetical protein BO78DRAFT_318761, partial [Aspergillus sclerotiicarbonarius CBS 121057]
TYDHRVWRTGLPVRSAVLKPHAGRLVVGWVTTSESLLLYVFVLLWLFIKYFRGIHDTVFTVILPVRHRVVLFPKEWSNYTTKTQTNVTTIPG